MTQPWLAKHRPAMSPIRTTPNPSTPGFSSAIWTQPSSRKLTLKPFFPSMGRLLDAQFTKVTHLCSTWVSGTRERPWPGRTPGSSQASPSVGAGQLHAPAGLISHCTGCGLCVEGQHGVTPSPYLTPYGAYIFKTYILFSYCLDIWVLFSSHFFKLEIKFAL